PRATQPYLYQDIDNHPTTANVFAERLQKEGIVEQDELKNLKKQTENKLREIYENMKENDSSDAERESMTKALTNGLDRFDTTVPLDTMKKLNKDLQSRPEGFTVFRKLKRILSRRENVLEEGNKADWGAGEALTYASILNDGIPIRLTGQDTERGTFAHRHSVLHDVNTGKRYIPFHGLKDAQASFDVRNSPLSEAGVLGFEYGYSVQSQKKLVTVEE